MGQEIAIIKELSAEYKFKFLCISFEPVPELFQIITNKYKNEISTGILEVNQFAIGKPKKISYILNLRKITKMMDRVFTNINQILQKTY